MTCRPESTGGGLGSGEVLKVGLRVSKEGADEGFVLIYTDSHQDSCSAVLDILQLLQVLARNPCAETIPVVQSRGGKGMDELFSM